ncbi:hypothetical protein AVEN_204167-1 [Araneus ventricosus]|uniref:Uncharacterized protein n=1 Tax=Araneus ventricosus TaxID=182803 RepID=A0A4Y2DKM1_ARAVE|nr:hypothetical protein AVEN_204167-1 [Araneus ventricosus]
MLCWFVYASKTQKVLHRFSSNFDTIYNPLQRLFYLFLASVTYLRPQENSFFNGHYRYLPIDGVVNNKDLIPLRRTDEFANVATDLVRYQRNERERMKIAGTRTQRTADLNLQYHRLAFRYNPAVQVDMLSLDS